MLDEMPRREWRDRDKPRIRRKARHEQKDRDQDERVPYEVDPFDVELADDALSACSGQVLHVQLDHLRDVLEEVRGLGYGEEPKEGDPRGREEAVGMSPQARRHR
jgi:hypothetical protein